MSKTGRQGIEIYHDVKGNTYGVLRGCENDAINIIKKLTDNQFDFSQIPEMKMRKSYRVKVETHVDDTFDPVYGERVAVERVLEKYDNDLRRVFEVLYDISCTLDDAVDKADNYMSKRNAAQSYRIEHRDELVSEIKAKRGI